MNKFVKSFFKVMLLAAFVFVVSCDKDDDKSKGSEERSITAISFEGQVGDVTIKRTSADAGEVLFTWNVTTGSLSSVVVKSISISDKATASVKAGDALNFDNADNTAIITVSAENGTKLDWKIKLTPFTPDAGSGENAIISIKFIGQLGDATVGESDVTFMYDTKHGAISSIEIEAITVSDKATASVKVGDKLDFNNESKTATITVTAENNTPATWTLKVIDTAEPAAGKWLINNMWLYGGPPRWGGSAVFQFKNQKTWNWNQATGPKGDVNNILEIILVGVNAEGNNYGTFTHTPCAPWTVVIDEVDVTVADYADFIYSSQQNDLNHIYRRIPIQGGTWVSNKTEGTFTFIDKDKNEFVCKFGTASDFNDYVFYEEDDAEKKPMVNDGGVDLTADVEALMANWSFMFDVNGLGTGTIDDDPDWGDRDKFQRVPIWYWVEVKKAAK